MQVVPADDVRVTAAPVYCDYQAIYTYRPESGDRVARHVLRLVRRCSADPRNPADGDPPSRQPRPEHGFHRLSSPGSTLRAGIEHEITCRRLVRRSNLGSARVGLDVDRVRRVPARRVARAAGRRVRLIGGFDVATPLPTATTTGRAVPARRQSAPRSGPLTGQQKRLFNGHVPDLSPGRLPRGAGAADRPADAGAGRARRLLQRDRGRGSVDPRLTARFS